jgi:ATP-binding cassette subfamily F protein uup
VTTLSKEKRELEGLPDRISALEAEQSALQMRLSDPVLYQDAPREVARLSSCLAVKSAARSTRRWHAGENWNVG